MSWSGVRNAAAAVFGGSAHYMHLEVIAYPFIFVALFFEVFLFVTFLSAPARAQRERKASKNTPKIAMIVPCYNEEATVEGTTRSLLALEYPKNRLSIILVNDGSTDNTKSIMDTFTGNPQIQIIHKENGGKHSAINAGIEISQDAEFIGCLDADSFVAPDALREIISCFDNPRVAAATPAMSVHEPSTLLERMQNAEFIFGIALRHIVAAVNGLYVTPGPFSLYRLSVIREIGGFRFGHQAEDMEMALRIQRHGYEIDNAPRARVFAKSPSTVRGLIKQRTRWTSGFLRNVAYDYRDMVGNARYGALGIMILPLGFIAVAGGVLMFFLGVFMSIRELVTTILVTHGVPLSYTLVPHSFEIFYFPITSMLVLAIIVTGGILLFITLGKRVSQTPGALIQGMCAYLILFPLIAPFWLIRSFADVATGHKRSWR
jgi:cellulose synthase/poly-beta-1,6-N-acetylglucosamine synthase-like glycosyltransferase